MGNVVSLFRTAPVKKTQAQVPPWAMSCLSASEIERVKIHLHNFDSWRDFVRRAVVLMCWCLEEEAAGNTVEIVQPDRKKSMHVQFTD